MTRVNKRSGVRGAGLAVAALAMLAVPVMAQAAAESPTVRVTRLSAGRAVLEVADNVVTVRKDVSVERSIVTVTTAKDRLTITVRRGVLSISGPDGEASMDTAGTRDDRRVVAMLQRSEAAARGRMLLARVTDGPETFVGQSLLLTRGILEVGSGSMSALNQQQQWVSDRAAALAGAQDRRGLSQPMLIRAAYVLPAQDRGPGECWDIYAKEGIRIADDYKDCTHDLHWYDALGYAGCALIYSVRSEGAMAWYIACNGGAPFRS